MGVINGKDHSRHYTKLLGNILKVVSEAEISLA